MEEVEGSSGGWDPPNHSLLQQIRGKPGGFYNHQVPIHPVGEQARQRRKLILRHRSEFPLRLREAIAKADLQASCTPQASEDLRDVSEIFCSRFHNALIYFSFGESQDVPDDKGWHGLNRHVDTEDQAELALRLFPIKWKQKTFLDYIQLLKDVETAVSFIPLCLKLAIDASGKNQKHQVWIPLNTLKKLLFNRYGNECGLDELESESLSVLVRLRDMGFVDMGICGTDLLHFLLEKSIIKDKRDDSETAFLERRLRLLVAWMPSLLVACDLNGRPHCNLLYAHLRYIGFDFGIFQAIFELGMVHYPQQLGFLFHDSNFRLTCQEYGNEIIAEMVRNKMIQLGQQDKNQELKHVLLEVATNPKIAVDGVYSLLRLNPVALCQSSSTTSTNTTTHRTRKRKRLVSAAHVLLDMHRQGFVG